MEGDIVVEVEDEDGGEEEVEEDFNPWSSEEPSSFSGHASNSLSSLGQPIPSRYPFAFRHPARGGSMSSMGSPPFAFSRVTATPQSKSTSTRESHETHSTGNVETASSSPSGSPTSAVSPSSSVPIPQDVRGMPMPPRHPAAVGGRHLPSTAPNPVSLHQRAVLRPRGHDKLSRGTVSCVRASARKSYRSLIGMTTAHPAWDSLHPMAPSRRANAKIPLAFFLHLHLSRVLGHRYSVHATAVRRPSHESVALSDPVLVHEILAWVRLQAAVVHDTIPMSQCLAHHWRLNVPAHTV